MMSIPNSTADVLARLDALTKTVAQLATVVTSQSPVTATVATVKDIPVATVKDGDMVTATFRHGDTVIGVIAMPVHDFVKSGNHGFWGNGKLTLAGKRYQTQSQMVALKD